MSTATDHSLLKSDCAEETLGIESSFPVLVRLTEEVFQEPASILVESGAELPAIRYAVVETTAENDLKEVAQRRREWHRRVRDLLGVQSRKVRLSVDLRE
ncbi:MAG: hypothetical protein KY476_12010 [Planctomycetes bacterium]|nr:hypothetical protein [Planctomycetota bacterium]